MNDASTPGPDESPQSEFEKQAAGKSRSIVGEMTGFLWANKAWWLAPIVLMLLVFGVLIFLAGTAAAPFIYTLF